MWVVDLFSAYLFGLKYVAIIVALCIVISSIDDVFIDIAYWTRRCWRALVTYKKYDRLDYSALYEPAEKPLAIMIPAWRETGVIGPMAKLAASTLDYENYHIFVGTYPNDPDTQRDVDEVTAHFPNVHKVVCARPGPTSKADCLNNVLDAILQFEQRAHLNFSGFILHDSEDVISSMELRLFNYLVGHKDLIQVPVYPFVRKWTNLTSMSYVDEFTEVHGKDIPVREAIAGQVPSAGVGTCFSRQAVLALLEEGDGVAFDTQSLTEDYDIGFRLKEKGMKEIFVRFPVLNMSKADWSETKKLGQSFAESNVICVREYFPDTIKTAVRQKSRWIIGIVFQGYLTHRWSKNWILNYFLWRDRKGAITNFVSFAATLILMQLTLIWVYQHIWPDAYQFLSIFDDDKTLVLVLWLNLVFMINRMLQRIFFVSTYYGLLEGLMSIPRLFWGNFINFLANWRAIKQIIVQGNPHRVAWDKTRHDFPQLAETSRARKMLGKILIEHGALTQEQLELALTRKARGLKLGSWLIHENLISSEALARALAEQGAVNFASIDAYGLSACLINAFPAKLALHYAVLPIESKEKKLIVASESIIDPISLAALGRKLGKQVEYVIAHIGQVTIGLRHWYVRTPEADPKALMTEAVNTKQLTQKQGAEIWAYFVSRQILFAEILMSLGRIDTASLSALLLQHENTIERLGDFLVSRNVISQQTLEEALSLQKAVQPSIKTLITRGIPEQQARIAFAQAGLA
jgi:adsorption protein B